MKVVFIAMLCFLSASASVAQERNTIEERQELIKMSKEELNSKASKDARKEAKRLKKEGWNSAPGALPFDKQLDRSYLMQMEYDEDMFPKYLMAERISVGTTYDAAKMQAMALAKEDLAGQIQTEITALVENKVANNQLGTGDAESVTKSVQEGMARIETNIGRVIPVVEVHRTLKNGNKEVLVRIAYSSSQAKSAVKKAIIDNLDPQIVSKLDEIIGW